MDFIVAQQLLLSGAYNYYRLDDGLATFFSMGASGTSLL